MTTYERLASSPDAEGVTIYDRKFRSPRIKGLYCDGNIAVSDSLNTDAEKACVLSEELGHYHTTVGDIIDQSSAANRKQELRARLWSYNKLIGLHGIISGFEHHCRTIYEMAEYLGVTEEFFLEALYCYRNKYGLFTRCDNYLIYFEPSLKVVGLFNVQGEDDNE